MSNPTSNFGWQMPTNTDLVSQLPADFEVFGQAVDTSLADLKGGTTGQILAKNSNTDMDFVWSSPNPGDITAVTAGTGISGGGTSGDVTITNSMATAITTNGDLIYGTGSGTFSRLGIGTTGQVLNVSGGIPAWTTPAASGGMTSIASGSLSGSTVTISSIAGTYKNLVLFVRNFIPSADGETLNGRVNGITSAVYSRTENFNTTVPSNETFFYITGQGQDNAVSGSFITSTFYDYANTATFKLGDSSHAIIAPTTTTDRRLGGNRFIYNQTSAISSITMFVSAGTMGGTYILYGVN